MIKYYLNLHLFGEGAGGEAGASVSSADAAQTMGGGTMQDATATGESFAELVAKGGRFHDEYSESVQKIIAKKTGKLKATEEKLSKYENIGNILMSRYGIEDLNDIDGLTQAIESDNSLFEDKAMEMGLTVDQYRQLQKIERENAILRAEKENQQKDAAAQEMFQQWAAREAEVKNNYPDFNFQEELQDPQFERLIRSGVDMEQAYVALHHHDILSGAMQYTAQAIAKKTADSIAARGSRPMENGMSGQAAATSKSDISKLNKQDRAAILAQALAGKAYRFS